MLSALAWSGSLTGPIDVGQALRHVETVGAGETALIVFSTVLISLVFQPLQLELVRLLEGYWDWGWLERSIGDRRREKYQSHWEQLTKDTQVDHYPPSEEEMARVSAAQWRQRQLYPEPARILPTRLGNVLRAAEDRAGQRYGLETVIVWPRLYPLIPMGLSRILAEERNQLDVSARLCAVLLLTSTVYLAVILFEPFGWPGRWLWLWVPMTTFTLAWFSYRGAISAATAYGVSIETAFDHHRFDLLAALHRPLPSTHQQELAHNEELSRFFMQGLLMLTPYEHRRKGRAAPQAPKPSRRKRKAAPRQQQKRK